MASRAFVVSQLFKKSQKQFKPNRKNTPASCEKGAADLPSGKKKRGAPAGHPGWFRPKPTEIDRIVDVAAPQRCPHCGSSELTPIDESMEHIQEDIVLVPRPVVTRYVHGQAFCSRCRRPVVQAAPDEILHAPIGPVAKATAMYLRYEICIPYRKVAEIFRVLFGLSSVSASLVGFDQIKGALTRFASNDGAFMARLILESWVDH